MASICSLLPLTVLISQVTEPTWGFCQLLNSKANLELENQSEGGFRNSPDTQINMSQKFFDPLTSCQGWTLTLTGRPQQHFVSLGNSVSSEPESQHLTHLLALVHNYPGKQPQVPNGKAVRSVVAETLLMQQGFPLGNSTFKDPSFKGSFIEEALYLSKRSRLVERM